MLPAIALVLLGAVACAAGCGDAERAVPGDAPGRGAGTATRGGGIASLSPAITHTVERLGAGEMIAGCTPWCGRPGTPVVGSLEDRDLETIAAIRPALVLRQSGADDPALDRVAASIGASVRSWRLSSVAEVRSFVEDVGTILGKAGSTGAAAAATRAMEAHRAAIARPVRFTGAVAFLYSADPLGAFGAGTYVADLWESMGGSNAVLAHGYPSLTAEDLAAMRPAAVVLVGKGGMPGWLTGIVPVHASVDAAELLEPGLAMLVDGPASLRKVDAALAGELSR